MSVDPVQVFIKTATNYVAFKSVKTGVDYAFSKGSKDYQELKAAECQFCLKVWSDSPERCHHCHCKVMKKLYREYDYRRQDESSAFEIDNNLTMKA